MIEALMRHIGQMQSQVSWLENEKFFKEIMKQTIKFKGC